MPVTVFTAQPVQKVTVTNDGMGRQWTLTVEPYISSRKHVRISDDNESNPWAMFLTPGSARDLAESLERLADQLEAL